MIKIVPTIIAKDFQELQKKVKKVEPYVEWAQLDVMDGRFVNNTTWNNPADLSDLETSLKLEAHLMIDKPQKVIDEWIKSGIKRIIFHYESTGRPKEVIKRIKEAGLEVGMALSPETPAEVINDDFVNQLDLILVMTVKPGWGGQKFIEETLYKVRTLRARYHNVNIMVDGGINSETAPRVIGAGANLLAVGTAIFQSDNIEQTIKELKQNGS